MFCYIMSIYSVSFVTSFWKIAPISLPFAFWNSPYPAPNSEEWTRRPNTHRFPFCPCKSFHHRDQSAVHGFSYCRKRKHKYAALPLFSALFVIRILFGVNQISLPNLVRINLKLGLVRKSDCSCTALNTTAFSSCLSGKCSLTKSSISGMQYQPEPSGTFHACILEATKTRHNIYPQGKSQTALLPLLPSRREQEPYSGFCFWIFWIRR